MLEALGLNFENLSVDDNGRVTFSGLSSGIDSVGTVDAIIAARRIPVDNLETTVETNKLKIDALEEMSTGMETLRSSLSRLYGAVSVGNTSDIFSGKQAFASTSRVDGGTASVAGNLIGVTVSNAAATGSHTIEILQTARAHKISSDSFSSTTTALGFTTGDEFTITSDLARDSFESSVAAASTTALGSTGSLSFTDANGNAIGTVAYTAADTIADFAAAITTNVTGVTASIETVTGGVRINLVGDDDFKIAEGGAGTVLTDLEIGVRKISVASTTSLLDLRDLINQANIGGNATGVSASIVTVTASENYLILTADDTGVTMDFAQTNGTPLDDVGFLDGSGGIKNSLQSARNAELYADGLLDQTNTLHESDFQSAATVQVGSNGTLTFTRDSDSNVMGAVAYTSGMTLTDLAAAITAGVTDTTAEVITDGAGVRLEITSVAGVTISETGGGTAIEDLGIDNKRRTIERSSNTIDDLFTGVTLSLFAAEAGTEVQLEVEQDLSQVKTEIVSFVEAYNALRQVINGHRLVDETTGTADEESGVLFSSRALNEVSSALSQILGNGVSGVSGNFSVLSQIGVDFVDINQDDPLLAENLEIDDTKLDEVLLANADDVRRLFTFDFTSNDPRVTMLSFDGNTTFDSAGFALNIQPGSGSNLNQYSEEADNAYWSTSNGTIGADAILAPDGTTTADSLIASVLPTTHLISTAAPESFTSGQSYIYSTYAKKGDVDNARIAFNGLAFGGGAVGADFDLDTGTVLASDAGLDSTSIEDVGNGWYRISIKAMASATSTANLERYAMDVTTTFTGDGATASTYFWGSQLEDVTTETSPGDYLKTTSATVTGVTASANIGGAADGSDDGSATINGNTITINSGDAQGLTLFFDGFDFTQTVQLDYTVGLGADMFFKLGELLDNTTGIVEGEIDQLTDQNTGHEDRIAEILARLEIQRQSLLERFIAMETSIATANNILDSIRQTTEALFASNN